MDDKDTNPETNPSPYLGNTIPFAFKIIYTVFLSWAAWYLYTAFVN